jgi:ketosteroid isomerase-like protein
MRALLAAVLLCAACGASTPKRPSTPGPVVSGDAKDQLPAALEQWRQGYEVRSVDALAPLYSATDDLTLVVQGRVVTTWPSVHATLTDFFAANNSIKVELQDVRIMALGGDGAIVVASVKRRYGDGIRSTQETGTVTLLFRLAPPEDDNRPATWRIALEHYSFRSGS